MIREFKRREHENLQALDSRNTAGKYSRRGKRNHNFRLYETYQGARVIVLGKNFDPLDNDTFNMMKEFNCDSLYTAICRKQGCFRARLTPKPRRINMESFKVKYPREGMDGAFENWLQKYERESRNYSVCKFIEQIGVSTFGPTEAIRIHDEMTGATFRQTLA